MNLECNVCICVQYILARFALDFRFCFSLLLSWGLWFDPVEIRSLTEFGSNPCSAPERHRREGVTPPAWFRSASFVWFRSASFLGRWELRSCDFLVFQWTGLGPREADASCDVYNVFPCAPWSLPIRAVPGMSEPVHMHLKVS